MFTKWTLQGQFELYLCHGRKRRIDKKQSGDLLPGDHWRATFAVEGATQRRLTNVSTPLRHPRRGARALADRAGSRIHGPKVRAVRKSRARRCKGNRAEGTAPA